MDFPDPGNKILKKFDIGYYHIMKLSITPGTCSHCISKNSQNWLIIVARARDIRMHARTHRETDRSKTIRRRTGRKQSLVNGRRRHKDMQQPQLW